MDRERCKAGLSSEPVPVYFAVGGFGGNIRKRRLGGIKIRGRKVYSLAYADDVALVVEGEGGMKGMMKVLEGYLERKKLELNVGKTRIMRCRRGGGRWKK